MLLHGGRRAARARPCGGPDGPGGVLPKAAQWGGRPDAAAAAACGRWHSLLESTIRYSYYIYIGATWLLELYICYRCYTNTMLHTIDIQIRYIQVYYTSIYRTYIVHSPFYRAYGVRWFARRLQGGGAGAGHEPPAALFGLGGLWEDVGAAAHRQAELGGTGLDWGEGWREGDRGGHGAPCTARQALGGGRVAPILDVERVKVVWDFRWVRSCRHLYISLYYMKCYIWYMIYIWYNEKWLKSSMLVV